MGTKRFQFNTETLQYEQRSASWFQRVGRITLKTVLSIGMGFGLMLAYSLVFDTPRTQNLKRSREEMLQQVAMLQDLVQSASSQIGIIERRDNQVYRSIFEADTIPQSVRHGGVGGVDRYADLADVPDGVQIKHLMENLDQLQWRTYVQSKSFDEVARLAFEKDQMLHAIPAVQPVSVKELVRISSLFGGRRDPITGQGRMHAGVDFVGKTDTPIHATGDGIVIVATTSFNGYGNQVIVDHGFGYKTRYAHMNRILVHEGEKVKRGQVIGAMGSTGRSTGTHLHYEVLVKNKPVNPLLYFNDMDEEEYEQMLAHAEMQDLD